MAGPVYDVMRSARKAVAFKNQTVPGTAVALTTADLLDASEASFSATPLTANDPRITGSIHKRGQIRTGVSHEFTLSWVFHGPGATLPGLGLWVPGRLFSWLGFSETVIPAIAAEAYTAGTASAITLGATAIGTADLYKGAMIDVQTVGAAPTGFSMIQAYSAAKVATLARDRAIAATGNYRMHNQLLYNFSEITPAAGASVDLWEDGERRNFRDLVPTTASITLNTASRDGGDQYCTIQVSGTTELFGKSVEAPPLPVLDVPIPTFRNGQQDIARKQLGGASVTIDLNPTSVYPPNPNQNTGSDPSIRSGTTRSATYNLNRTRYSEIDFDVLAAAQTQHPSQFIWGIGSGNTVGIMIDNQRFMDPNFQGGQDYDTNSQQAVIDGINKCLSFSFPIYT